ncbi:hypothetical protein BKA60DRAFT_188940 [Fusarium oxysporum]|uniref:Uncharacterized protein n=1 Tax=Fusarium oxysporum TaxID=5507 RepID=A0A420NL49_FUSOX|nr:hypothetical protein BKA60DRAFT_188940 [Fusarium oxysporum]RKK81010.1 hypothetical protein BFJ69_g3922 [Fusarium oxysporum]
MVSQSSYHRGPSLDAPLATLASNSRFSKSRLHRLRQTFSLQRWQTSAPINTSSTTVDSSDISLKYGIPAVASGDLSYPLVEWGHQATPTVLRPTFYKLLNKLAPQSASPNNGHYKTYGTTSHQTRSKKSDKAGHRRKSTSKGTRDSGSGGGGKGGKGRGGSNGPPPPDGYRFPPFGDSRPPKYLGCPFYMTEPLRHHACSSLRLSRPSDVSQHIMRTHLLQEINLVLRRDTESTDRTETGEAGTCTNANDIRRYHARCRMEFHGPNAEENLRDHCRNFKCYEAGIEETGVMLLSEFKNLTNARDAANGSVAKWYAMWRVCYPPTSTRGRTVPASPYVETTVPREQGEYIIRQALMSSTDQSLVSGQIVNGIYLGVETDREVQQIVQDQQQQQRDLELQGAFRSTSTSSHPHSTGLEPWRLSLQETPGLQHTSPLPSSSVTLPLQQQHELLAGQPSNSIATSSGSLPQQYQMPYRTSFPSIVPSTFSLQPQMVQLENTSTNYSPPGSQALPETSDPASQQTVCWYWNNPATWNPDHYGDSQ